MRKHIHISILLATALLLHSCGDFLDEKSQSEVIPQTATDFSELLIGSAYPDNYSPNFAFVSYLDDDCEAYLDLTGYDENWMPIDGFSGSAQAISPLPYYSWQPYMMDQDGYGGAINTVSSSTTYSQFYSKIMGCNAVLDNIDEALGAQTEKDRVKAEALTIRALLYFQLVNLYGEPYNYNKEALGVPLKLDTDLSKDGIPRATVAEVYEDVIVPDLQLAAQLMDPLEIIYKNYRTNQPSIHILLSRVYLFMERYQDCIDEANKALNMGIRLMNLPSELGTLYLDYSYNPFTYDNPEILWLFGPGARAENSAYRSGHASGFRAIWDQTNDLRWSQYGLALYYSSSVIKKPYGSIGFSQNIRTAEAYLNKMEAEALLGKNQEAKNDLNTFCKTRIMNYSDQELSGDALLTAIRNERRKEFCFEGFRWFDLRRQGMPEITHIYREEAGGPVLVYTLQHNDPLYTLPLPNVLFEKNVELQQNASRDVSERQAKTVE
jgi:hypothetical protein